MLDHVQRAVAVADLHDAGLNDAIRHPGHPHRRLLHHHRLHNLEQGKRNVGESTDLKCYSHHDSFKVSSRKHLVFLSARNKQNN